MPHSLPPVIQPTWRVIPPSDPLIQPAQGLHLQCPGAVTPRVRGNWWVGPSSFTHNSNFLTHPSLTFTLYVSTNTTSPQTSENTLAGFQDSITWKGSVPQQPLRRLDYCSFCCMLVGVIPCHVFGQFHRGFCLHLLQLWCLQKNWQMPSVSQIRTIFPIKCGAWSVNGLGWRMVWSYHSQDNTLNGV